MLYLVVALKAEAQAFIDKYKLKKSQIGVYSLFYDDSKRLIISGMGVQNARLATQTLINSYDITDDDIYINVGISGANKNYTIGELLNIGSIIYNDITYSFDAEKIELVTLDAPAKNNRYDVVDMEAYGFYDAVIHNPAIKKFHIFKIVSDYFEPESVTKDRAKMLIFNNIDDINRLITK